MVFCLSLVLIGFGVLSLTIFLRKYIKMTKAERAKDKRVIRIIVFSVLTILLSFMSLVVFGLDYYLNGK